VVGPLVGPLLQIVGPLLVGPLCGGPTFRKELLMATNMKLIRAYLTNSERLVVDKICRSNSISVSSFVRQAIQKEITRYVAENKVK